MVADTESARRWSSWAIEDGQPWWIGLLANVALVLTAVGVGLGILYLSGAVAVANVEATAITIIGIAAAAGVAAFAGRWVHGALAGRLDILSQALEASPDAQLIVAADGSVAYANTAFHHLFPQASAMVLDRIAEAVADPESSVDFVRLRRQAGEGTRGIAAVPLREPGGGAAGWFSVEVNPIAGRPGYSYWNIQDITARHEMEAVIRDERNKLIEFLEDAPIGGVEPLQP